MHRRRVDAAGYVQIEVVEADNGGGRGAVGRFIEGNGTHRGAGRKTGNHDGVGLRPVRHVMSRHGDGIETLGWRGDEHVLLDIEAIGGTAGGRSAAGEDVAVEAPRGAGDGEVEIVDQLHAGGERRVVVGPDQGDLDRLGAAGVKGVFLALAGRKAPLLVVDEEQVGIPREKQGLIEEDAAPALAGAGDWAVDIIAGHVHRAVDHGRLYEGRTRRHGVVGNRAAGGVIAVDIVLPDECRASRMGGTGHGRAAHGAEIRIVGRDIAVAVRGGNVMSGCGDRRLDAAVVGGTVAGEIGDVFLVVAGMGVLAGSGGENVLGSAGRADGV